MTRSTRGLAAGVPARRRTIAAAALAAAVAAAAVAAAAGAAALATADGGLASRAAGRTPPPADVLGDEGRCARYAGLPPRWGQDPRAGMVR